MPAQINGGKSQDGTRRCILRGRATVTVVTVATITAIAALKVFDIVAATTGGNFGTSTIANEFYRVFFVQNRSGF